MKVIILDEVEQFCAEHNFTVIGVKRLRDMAIDETRIGLDKAYMAGYGKCNQAVIEAMAANRPKEANYGE